MLLWHWKVPRVPLTGVVGAAQSQLWSHLVCGPILEDVFGLSFFGQVQALENATRLLPLQRKSRGLNRNTVTQDGPVNTAKPFLE